MQKRDSVKGIVAAMLLVVVATVGCGSLVATPTAVGVTSTPQETAWHLCMDFIEIHPGLPVADAQEYSPAAVTASSSDMYTVKISYNGHTSFYGCTVVRQADGKLRVKQLAMAQ